MRVIDNFPAIKKVEGEVGIEIEMEGLRVGGDGYQAAPKIWVAHNDGSLRGESIEWVLNKPIPRDKVEEALTQLKTFLTASKSKINDSDRAGVHVHLNCQEMEVSSVLNFMLTYLLFEDVLVHYCGDSREGNLFCLRVQDAEGLLFPMLKAKREGRLNIFANDIYRYASINPVALSKYGSLEFRSLKTPVDVMKVEEWVNILLKVKDYAAHVQDSRDIVEAFSRNGEEGFMTEVFGKDLTKTLMVDDLARTLRDSVRRIQHVAYIKTPNIKEKTKQDFWPDEKLQKRLIKEHMFYVNYGQARQKPDVVLFEEYALKQLRRYQKEQELKLANPPNPGGIVRKRGGLAAQPHDYWRAEVGVRGLPQRDPVLILDEPDFIDEEDDN